MHQQGLNIVHKAVRQITGDAVLVINRFAVGGQLVPGRGRGEAKRVVHGFVIEEDRAGGAAGQIIDAAVGKAHDIGFHRLGQGSYVIRHCGIARCFVLIDIALDVYCKARLNVINRRGGIVENNTRSHAVCNGVIHRVRKAVIGLLEDLDFVLVLALVERGGLFFKIRRLIARVGVPNLYDGTVARVTVLGGIAVVLRTAGIVVAGIARVTGIRVAGITGVARVNVAVRRVRCAAREEAGQHTDRQ